MKTIKIGRNADNDIVVKDDTNTVSGYHAEVNIADSGVITICDISRNGTRVNGILIVKKHDHILNAGDDVQFARAARLDLSKIPFPKDPEDATHISDGAKESYTIGTSSDNRIVLNDTTSLISRHHAILKLMRNGKYIIYDQSTNGTYVNGVKIRTKTDFPVSVTDQISFAQVQQFDWRRVTKVPVQPAAPRPSAPNKPITTASSSNDVGIWVFILVLIAIGVGIGWYSAASKTVSEKSTAATVHVQAKPKFVSSVVPTTSSSSSLSVGSSSTLSNLYEQKKNAVILIYTSDGTSSAQGSGFFISSSGVAVSNYHVFKGTTPGLETIKTTNGNTYKVESVLAKSEESDYIVFKVASQGSSFPYLQIAQTLPRVGENVFAIGAPEGLELTLSTGIVSAMRQNNRVIQTTTEITHGSSGGPLFNMNGQVIGITSSGMGAANLNFAVNLVGLNLNH